AVRGGLAFRRSRQEGSVSPGRPARTGICRTGIPPAGIRMVLEGQPLCCPQYNLAFTDETELVPPIPVSRLANEHLQLTEPIPIRHGISRPFISQSERLEMVPVDSFLRRDNGRSFTRDSEGPRRGSY